MSKILILSAHTGHLDRRIVAEMNTLARAGRDVTLLSVPAEIPSDCLEPGLRVIAPAAPAAGGRSWPRRIAAVLPQPIRGWAQAIWHRKLFRSDIVLRRFFAELAPRECFDAIHCHDLPTLPAALALRSLLPGSPKVIFDSHELFPYQVHDRGYQRYWSRVEREHIHQADAVVTVNESLARLLVQVYGIRLPLVLYNSYGNRANHSPLSRQDFYSRFQAPPAEFRVLFQGGFDRHRNLLSLTEAFGLLDDSYQLFLLGTGPFQEQIEFTRRRLGLRNVWLGGWVPQQDLLRYTVHADLGIIPYDDDGGLLNMVYCTPNKLFEFIEAQVPICGSDLPEIERIVRTSGIGGVYPMKTPHDIAGAIRDCRRRSEQGDFPLAVRAAAREQFAWQKQGERLVDLYEELGI